MYLSKKRKIQTIMTGVVYLFLVIVGIYLVWLKKLDCLYPSYLINISVDLFGMLLGYVLFICSLIDVQRTGARQRYFFYLLNVTYTGLFLDLLAWLVNGVARLRLVNLCVNTLYFICMPLEVFFFWRYVRSVIKADGKTEQYITYVMKWGLIFSLITRGMNLFTGMYFSVGADGVYTRGDKYYVSMLYAFFLSAATIVLLIRKRKKLERYKRVILLLYIIMPTVAGVFTMAVYGLSISYGVIMLVMLLMYCVLNIDQGRQKVAADRELAMATAIQEGILPHVFPPFPERPEFELYASMHPAKEVGGDFYDFFLTDDDHLALVIADVSGKGVPAALFMMVTKVLLKNRLADGDSPGKALENVNRQLLEGEQAEMFVTVWIAVLELSTGKGIAANAGHEHPVLKRAGGEYELVQYRHSPAVATIEGIRFREHEFEMQPGDTLFVYTDGVPEATNKSDELFGTERMLEALNRHSDMDVTSLLPALEQEIALFVGEEPQFDDITMLGLKYLGSVKGTE